MATGGRQQAHKNHDNVPHVHNPLVVYAEVNVW